MENGPEGTYVFIVNAHAMAEQRMVKVERTTSKWAVVSGVKAGERVVTDGQSRLQSGSPVTLKLVAKS